MDEEGEVVEGQRGREMGAGREGDGEGLRVGES